MQIFTPELISEFATSFFSTFNGLKGAIVNATLTNIGVALEQISTGQWAAIFLLVGTLVLLWRIKSWVFSFFYHKLN